MREDEGVGAVYAFRLLCADKSLNSKYSIKPSLYTYLLFCLLNSVKLSLNYILKDVLSLIYFCLMMYIKII